MRHKLYRLSSLGFSLFPSFLKFLLLHLSHNLSLSSQPLYCPLELLLFFSFFPSSFSVSSCLFLVRLNLCIALSLISIAFFFSRSHSFLTQHFCSFAFSDSIYNSTHSSTSFSASLISSSPAPLSLSSCLTLTRHFFARILKQSLTDREMTGIPYTTREEATACHSAPLSLDPAFLLMKTPSAATARKSLTSFSLVHTIIDLMSIINKRF